MKRLLTFKTTWVVGDDVDPQAIEDAQDIMMVAALSAESVLGAEALPRWDAEDISLMIQLPQGGAFQN
jgi:hypothetical protein